MESITNTLKRLYLGLCLATAGAACAQGTAFTYQGRLNNGTGLATGHYDFAFALYGADAGGAALAEPVTNLQVQVSQGLFTTSVDFGSAFTGASNWLEIAVSPSGSNNFATLVPRQQLTPVPYALVAANVSGPIAAGALPASVVTNGATDLTLGGTFAGDGSGLTSVNAYSVNGLTTDGLWKLGGNVGANPTNGAFLGTVDLMPLELWVNTNRALRIEYALDPFTKAAAVPNLIGGYAGNSVSNGVAGAFIAGGGDPIWPNTVTGDFSSILGGHGNTAAAFHSFCIGDSCIASGGWSMALGTHAHALHEGTFVWADSSSSSFEAFESTTNHQFLLRAQGGVGIGTATPPPGGLNVASGGLAVSGASSPNYRGAKGVFIENEGSYGAVYAFNYQSFSPLPLCLNTPGGNVGIGTTTPAYPLQIAGSCAATTFVTTSDRNAKENFETVDPRGLLDRVLSLPVSRWNFKEDKTHRHLGPVAQDFHAAFGLNGDDDTHIATVDASGVALAAIQGLNEKLEQQLARKEREIAELKGRLDRLEQKLSHTP